MVDDDDLNNGKEGGGDFGCFRRQPSIRDRMKVNICYLGCDHM